jgi:hypothetical protein
VPSLRRVKPDPRMERHLKVIYPLPQDLFEAGEAVGATHDSAGWLHISRLIEYEIATIDAGLDGPNHPLTRAEYAMAHGRRDGLRGAQKAVETIITVALREYDRQRAKHEGDAEPSLNGG